MEGGKGHSSLLKHIAEGPVRIGLVALPQSGQLLRQKGRVLVGVMDRRIGYVGGVELRDVNLQPLVLREAVDDLSGSLQIGKTVLRLHQLRITVMSHILRQLRSIVMSGHKVHRNPVVMAVLHEASDPELVRSAADRRSAHAKGRIHLFDGIKGLVEQFEILLHIRMKPEAGKIGLVPYLDGPGQHLLSAVSVAQMSKQSLYHGTPGLIGGRRCGVPLPVKYRLGTAGQLLGHKAQFQKRLQAHTPVPVHHSVKIGEIVLCFPLRRLLIDRHIIGKQTVSSDMLETDMLLDQLQLVHILFRKRQTHPSGAHTEIHLIVKGYVRRRIHYNTFLLHKLLLDLLVTAAAV